MLLMSLFNQILSISSISSLFIMAISNFWEARFLLAIPIGLMRLRRSSSFLKGYFQNGCYYIDK